MPESAYFSATAPDFPYVTLPAPGMVVGYAAVISSLQLEMPLPRTIALVSSGYKKYHEGRWMVFPKSYLPEDTAAISETEALFNHLVFALKYEGINLLFFKKLIQRYSETQLVELLTPEPTGGYSRKIWFLIEWLSGKQLNIRPDLEKKGYVKLLDEKLQYGVEGIKSPRHRIINNLPGTAGFCPLVFRTPVLESFLNTDFSARQAKHLKSTELVQRASAYLRLKDSRASFTIEGESPRSQRVARWGQALAVAGQTPLSEVELFRLQRLILENSRFIHFGYRQKGGFVGEHDHDTGQPLPDHISAKWQDLPVLMQGLFDTCAYLLKSNLDAVITAAMVAFGFVFIHPFEDGNGRLHRYLIHHILVQKRFSPVGLIFPVSAAILNNLQAYKTVLEHYSLPLLDFIEWKETPDHNVEVINETIDYYRYFDATPQAEFLYACIEQTVDEILPQELRYIRQYDEFKRFMETKFNIGEKNVSLLVAFLRQNGGRLSKRAQEQSFSAFTKEEIAEIEEAYRTVFKDY